MFNLHHLLKGQLVSSSYQSPKIFTNKVLNWLKKVLKVITQRWYLKLLNDDSAYHKISQLPWLARSCGNDWSLQLHAKMLTEYPNSILVQIPKFWWSLDLASSGFTSSSLLQEIKSVWWGVSLQKQVLYFVGKMLSFILSDSPLPLHRCERLPCGSSLGRSRPLIAIWEI